MTWYLQMHLPYFILYIISGFQQEIVTLQGIFRGEKKTKTHNLKISNSDTTGIFKLSDKNFKQLINSIYYLGKNWQHTRADGNTSRNSNKYKEVFKFYNNETKNALWLIPAVNKNKQLRTITATLLGALALCQSH